MKVYVKDNMFKKIPNPNISNIKHYCEVPFKYHLRGSAIDDCYEDEDGFLFVSNPEYGSQVNFCPVCGYEAKKKIVNEWGGV